MTLRLRLSMLAVALVAAGLLAAGIATRYELRGFLIDRVDSQLQSATNPVSLYFERGDTDHGAQGPVLGVLPRGQLRRRHHRQQQRGRLPVLRPRLGTRRPASRR